MYGYCEALGREYHKLPRELTLEYYVPCCEQRESKNCFKPVVLSMKCAFVGCKSYSESKLKCIDGITFHLFPKDQNMMNKWIAALKQTNFEPNIWNKVCSVHFLDSNFYETKNGLRKLISTAVPSLLLGPSTPSDHNSASAVSSNSGTETIPFTQHVPSTSNNMHIGLEAPPGVCPLLPNVDDTPIKQKLKKEIVRLKDVAKQRRLRCNALYAIRRRLKKKVENLSQMLNELKEKRLIIQEQVVLESKTNALEGISLNIPSTTQEQLPNDMENNIQYHLMGSVTKIQMRAGCLPKKFGCQPDRKKRTDSKSTMSLPAKRQKIEAIAEFDKYMEQANSTQSISMAEVQPHPSSVYLKKSAVKESADLIKEEEESVVYLKESATFSSRVCRGCLAADVRLYDMRQNNLMEAYSTLLNTAEQVTDDLPHYLCSYCAALLLKCDTFRIKCIDALFILRNAQLENVQLSTDNIKRLTNLEQGQIETIDIIDETIKQEHYDIDVPSDSDDVKDYDTNIILKDHSVTDDIHTDHVIESNDENNILFNFNEEKDPFLKEFEVKEASDNDRMKQMPETVNHIQYSNKDCLDVSKGNVKEYTDPKIIETAMTIQNLEDVITAPESLQASDYKLDNVSNGSATPILEITDELTDSISDETDSSDLNDVITDIKKKSSIIDAQLGKSLGKRQRQVKDIQGKAKKFAAKYNMDVTHYSKEEQLKEIADRRESEEYKESEFKCNICYKGFYVEDPYNNHMLIHDDISGKIVCDICQCHFRSTKRLRSHEWSHSQLFTCKECEHTTKYIEQAKQHYQWHSGKQYTCKECGREFRKKSTLYGHVKACHPTSEKLVRCEICEDSFNGPVGLKNHEGQAHKEMRSPECYCSGCNTQFYCSDAFKAHQGADGLCITTHKYCVRCGMLFETEQLLKEHEIEQRKPRTGFICNVCHKTFKVFHKLKIHQSRHSKKIPKRRVKACSEKERDGEKSDALICEVCGSLKKDASQLKAHYLLKHTTERPFKCTICPMAFKLSSSRALHLKTHTGERPFSCQYCPKKFTKKINLERHNLVHTGERPHSCNVCGKTFQTASYVKEHIQTVHMKIPMPPRIRRRNKKTK